MIFFRILSFLLLLLSLPYLICATEWYDTGYGHWTVTHFNFSPFPVEETSDSAFSDNSVFIFVPAGYVKKTYFDLIVDHHGHGAIVDPHNKVKPSYSEKFRQSFQLFESRKNAILVMPQAAYNKASGAAGKFAESGGFEKFLTELTLFLKDNDIIFPETEIRQIHISSFSGGYNITAMDITRNSPRLVEKIKSINLWDSFYGQQDIFFDWVFQENKSFFSTYTPTGGTVSLNRLMIDSLYHRAIPFDSTYQSMSNKYKPFIQYTHRSHGNVANGEFSYGRYLKKLPLEDIDIRPPFLLSAIGNAKGINVHWMDQTNPHLKGFRLIYSENGDSWKVLADFDELTAKTTSFMHETNNTSHYRLQVLSKAGTTLEAPNRLTATPGDENPVLVVHAENRRLKNNIRGFNPDSFLYKINPDLVQIVASILKHPLASCSNYAIRSGLIEFNQFDYVIWLGGEENIRDKLIDHPEKIWLQKFLEQGGNLLISGSGVPADLSSVYTSAEDRIFGENIIGISGTDSIETDRNHITVKFPLRERQFNVDSDFPVQLAFKNTLLPTILLDNKYPVASLYKSFTADSTTSTILTLGFSLALTKNSPLQRYILDQFFEYAATGDITPGPPRLDKRIYVSQDTIHTVWPDKTTTFIGLVYNNKRTVIDTVMCQQVPIISGIEADSTRFIRLQVQSGNLISRQSELLGASRLRNNRGRVLIVSGYDRVTAENSFDFCVEHGISLNQLNFDFDTASNEAVISGIVNLADYELVDWMVGEESTTNQTFNSEEQQLITKYIMSGGKIMISGSEIGWDLIEKAISASDSLFFSSTLGAKYLGDNADTSRFLIYFNGESNKDTLQFGLTYAVNYPDILSTDENSDILLKYDTNQVAAVGRRHKNRGASILVAFPLETIAPIEKRTEVFRYLLDYLRKKDVYIKQKY